MAGGDPLDAIEAGLGDLLDRVDPFAVVTEQPDPEPSAEDRASALGSLVWRPHLRSRHGVGFLVARTWRAETKDEDLAAFKALKARLLDDVIGAAAAEIAEVADLIAPGVCRAVVPVACGHSRRPDCLSVRLARAVADRLGVPVADCFAFRPVAGSSHPHRQRDLPPLRFAADPPSGPALLVDDLTTTGFHMEQALTALRSRGTPAIGIAWIGGVTRRS